MAVLRIKDNPKNIIGITFKPLVVSSINELKERVGSKFKEPGNLPEGFSFREGQINSNIDDSIRYSILKEAEETRKDVVRVIEPSQEVGAYHIIYKKGNRTIDVSITVNYKWNELSQPDKGQRVTDVGIKNFDAIYTDGNGRSEIKWIDNSNGANILYSIGCPKGDATKEELLQLAASVA
ncbi:MAG TPA: hypothetical protein VHP38_00030 [Ruminiclostridium sp.]|nr:hypothetical protein [Ruminiclostridium sp.]